MTHTFASAPPVKANAPSLLNAKDVIPPAWTDYIQNTHLPDYGANDLKQPSDHPDNI